jgi:hypothetical protein
MAVGKTLSSNAVEKAVLPALTCRVILVDTGTLSVATTIEVQPAVPLVTKK